MLPWLQGGNLARFNRMLDYFLVEGEMIRANRKSKIPFLKALIGAILGKPVRWRIDHGKYSFPWELWLANVADNLVRRRSLIDGRELPTEAINVC